MLLSRWWLGWLDLFFYSFYPSGENLISQQCPSLLHDSVQLECSLTISYRFNLGGFRQKKRDKLVVYFHLVLIHCFTYTFHSPSLWSNIKKSLRKYGFLKENVFSEMYFLPIFLQVWVSSLEDFVSWGRINSILFHPSFGIRVVYLNASLAPL